jgi:chlorophyll synthase
LTRFLLERRTRTRVPTRLVGVATTARVVWPHAAARAKGRRELSRAKDWNFQVTMDTKNGAASGSAPAFPAPIAVLELLKPITWFPPMWAFVCGVVSSGVPVLANWYTVLAGVLLAGPLVCAMSQAINDWYDRHVDAINEPQRPIPSGRIPGKWGLYIAGIWTVLSLLVAATLGQWVVIATIAGLILAWAYSAPPFRLKANGWLGNAACGFSYESLAWITGAAAMLGGALPPPQVLVLALLYGAGAHGIMTLNDFKAIRGDREMGIHSLPVLLGPERAALVACIIMIVPQVIVIGLLAAWGQVFEAGVVIVLLAAQLLMMKRLLRDPIKDAYWYSGFGVPLYVLGMMASAVAVRMFAGS